MNAVGWRVRLASILQRWLISQMEILPPRATRARASRALIFSPSNSPIFRRAGMGTAAKQPRPLIGDRKIISGSISCFTEDRAPMRPEFESGHVVKRELYS